METNRQIFQTDSKLRWNIFKWISRLLLILLILMIPIIWISLKWEQKPFLPGLSKTNYEKQMHPVIPKDFSTLDKRKYKGFHDFLAAKQKNASYISLESKKTMSASIRAAFYVDWDPQAFSSLQSHINKVNMVLPEWCFIDPQADTLVTKIDASALAYMRSFPVKIVPILSNVNTSYTTGDFDGKLLDRILKSPEKQEKLIKSVEKFLLTNKFHGINLDFEEISDNTLSLLYAFQKKLYDRFHKDGLMVTQDIMPENNSYKVERLNPLVDYLFLMAYDQHYNTSIPGAISGQQWVEKVLDETARNIPSNKIVLCMATYGYDWPENSNAGNVTYQEAISLAKQYYAPIDFDNGTYSCSFSYNDYNGVKHQVYFNDAASNFNTMRFADDFGTAGVAIWRLGAEDERIWNFYNQQLTSENIKDEQHLFEKLKTSFSGYEKPDYIGEGEVLDVISEPNNGQIEIFRDSSENIVSEEIYKELPTRYVIKRFGQVNKQVILTFDDGPDPEYTPQILNILKKENVPATFFVVGINVEKNLPLFKQLYKDGFEIGNHTFTHPNIASVGMNRARTEMEATRLLIEAETGHSTILFRPPFNADAEPTKYEELRPVAISRQNNYYDVGESIDPEDWDVQNGVNADSIYNRIVRQYEQNSNKGIILLHDAGGNRQATVDALPRIIKYFKDRHIQFIDVATLLNLRKDKIMPLVKNDLLQADTWISKIIFGFSQFLNAAFWIAILLGMGRIAFIAILAIISRRKEKKEKLLPLGNIQDKVSIIVPAYNEELNCVATVNSLLKQDYPNIEIIFVDDGSKDNTFEVISNAFSNHKRVKTFTKNNGGKASALNFGIANATSDYLICIDADTQLKKDAISQLMRYFIDEQVGAVAGNVKVGNENNVLTQWQSIEYITAQNFDRRAFDYVNGITVVPGAIGAFRKQAIQEAGGFTTDSLAEDCDLTIRILRHGYIIRNCNNAIAVTEAPETVKQFLKQRFRWSFGIMQSFWKNRKACFNPRYKGLGLIALPNILIFQIILPIIAPLADLLFFISIFYNWYDSDSIRHILLYYGLFLIVDLLVGALAFWFEGERKYWKLLWLLPQRFVYRQLMYIVLFRSLRRAIKGEGQGWGNLKRTGNVVLKES